MISVNRVYSTVWQIIALIGQIKKMANNCEKTTKKDVNNYGENSKRQVDDESVSINPDKASLIETLSTEQQNLKAR